MGYKNLFLERLTERDIFVLQVDGCHEGGVELSKLPLGLFS